MPGLDIDVNAAGNGLAFDHVHIYADTVQEFETYKKLEEQFNEFDHKFGEGADTVEAGKDLWATLSGARVDESKYHSYGQDVVRQFICGAGWRVTASYEGPDTRSVQVTSPDKTGCKFIVTGKLSSAEPEAKKAKVDHNYDHFRAAHIERFYGCKAGRQGVAALGFNTADVSKIEAAYKLKHPALVVAPVHEYSGTKVFEVFAYYRPDAPDKADTGTVLRFIEHAGTATMLPGMAEMEATFPKRTSAAYSDHWVSNVVDRKQFLATLEDTLGFTPKVDFNAGVVAAGEAIIESTVTGNKPDFVAKTVADGLPNQQQIYLPINNALSSVGHVHLYLQEIGQGIQHIASRVEDLPGFIRTNNEQRRMTGEGFTFLNIPRSYYGVFGLKDLVKIAGIDEPSAKTVLEKLQSAGIVDNLGAVDLELTDSAIDSALEGVDAYKPNRDAIIAAAKLGRYNNMHALLGDHLNEEQYMNIVRNKILVDLQAGDVLYQIFTATILQREPNIEAPFLEFIQRVCSNKVGPDGKPKPVRPGCGGFGIRNFLTLFLSIEVSKAMASQEDARKKGDTKLMELNGDQVRTLTNQLDVSNPVLTAIAEAMTAEADALAVGDAAEAQKWKMKKDEGSERLKAISAEYKGKMGIIREQISKLA